jgi:3-hydroxyacyl-CoA dehydrogenase
VRGGDAAAPHSEEATVEVKIGVQYAPRELVLESTQTPAEVEQAVRDALASESGVLSLIDEKGRRVIVPVSKVGYVEIAEVAPRPIGFSSR